MQLQFTKLSIWTLLLFLTLYPAGATVSAGISEPDSAWQSTHPSEENQQVTPDCEHIGAMLEAQKQLLSREIGQVKREMALLRQDLASPGLRDIFAGIGYIFGLAGIAFYLQSRKGAQRQ